MTEFEAQEVAARCGPVRLIVGHVRIVRTAALSRNYRLGPVDQIAADLVGSERVAVIPTAAIDEPRAAATPAVSAF